MPPRLYRRAADGSGWRPASPRSLADVRVETVSAPTYGGFDIPTDELLRGRRRSAPCALYEMPRQPPETVSGALLECLPFLVVDGAPNIELAAEIAG